MFEVTNQTTTPQELSHKRHLGGGETKRIKEIGSRERALEARGVIFIKDVENAPAPATGKKAAKPTATTAPDSGNQ